MPLTVQNLTGDGQVDPLIRTSVELPDSGTSVIVAGVVQAVGQPAVPLTGSPVTIPAAPLTGQVFYAIEANTTTGALTVLQSTSAMPTPDAGNVIIFAQTLSPTSTDAALTAESTPDSY